MPCRSQCVAAAAGVAAVSLALLLRRKRKVAKAFPPAKAVEDPTRRGLRKQDLPEEADAIVIGAGPAGLSLAVLLGNFGRKVLVLEQHDRAGGGLHSFTEQGYDFETGFHYVGELKPGQELRAIVDSITNHEVTFTNLERSDGIYDRVVFENDSENIGVPNGMKRWLQLLEEKFPEEQKAIQEYGRDLEAATVTFFPLMVWRTLPFEWLRRLLRPLLAAPGMKLSMPAGERMDERAHKERKTQSFHGIFGVGLPRGDPCCGGLAVSSCFLAVLAYRYIINEILPRKAYLTAADKYITFACVFLILICVQTVICTCWRSRIEKMDRDIDEELLSAKMAKLRRRQRLEYQDLLEYYDMMAGVFLSLAWVAWNIYLWCLWKWSKREPWHRVYANNEEPYAPVEECTACGLRWLAKQATHTDPKCTQCCPDKDCGAQKDQVRKIYLTPKQLPEPFVPPQPLPDGPKIG